MNKSLINYARFLSCKSDLRFKLGAVIFKKNCFISSGYNQRKTAPFLYFKKYKWLLRKTGKKQITLHAEMNAIIRARRFNTNGASIIVYRETKDGKMANAMPCSFCLVLLKEFGFRKVYFTTKNGIDSINI